MATWIVQATRAGLTPDSQPQHRTIHRYSTCDWMRSKPRFFSDFDSRTEFLRTTVSFAMSSVKIVA